jgi:hypothetical protein
MIACHQNIGGGPGGVCQVFWWIGEGGKGCTIERADPKIWISPEFLEHCAYPAPGFTVNPAISLTLTHGTTQHCGLLPPDEDYGHCCTWARTPFCFRDALLRIAADNCTVVYRIGRYLAEQHVWEGQWPD